MNTKNKIIMIITIIIIIMILYSYNFRNNNHYSYTATSGIVYNKEIEDVRYIYFATPTDNDSIDMFKIVVEDENIWNLIEINRSYFIQFSSRNKNMHYLEQIAINDDFIKINLDFLKNLERRLQ